MTMQRIALTGANRGLGLAFAHQWLEAGHQVFAMARNPEDGSFSELKEKFPDRLRPVACDVADDASVDSMKGTLEAETEALDLVLNNAGMFDKQGGGIMDLKWEGLRQTFEVNTLGPLRVTRALLPLLHKGRRARLVHMTSLMGSITDNTSGGSWSYRMSKTALNMASRNLAVELAPATIPSVVLHPGWVQTDMGGAGAPLGIDEAVRSMVATIEGLSMAQSGRFLDREGQELPW